MAMVESRLRRVLHWVRNGGVVLVACYGILLLFVRVSEKIMRHRAERLLTEMRELKVGKSTWADLQRIRTQWGKWGNYEGGCNERHCDYTVSLSDVPGPWRFADAISFLGHGHLASVSLNLTVDGNVVQQTYFELMVAVPKGYGTRWERAKEFPAGYMPYSGGEYALIARAGSSAEIRHLCCYWPNPIPHPDYALTKPSGCEGCLAIWANFVPQATASEKLLTTNFNFECITRWKPCSDEEDIIPEVGEAYEREIEETNGNHAHATCTDYSMDQLSRAALNAAVVDVKSVSNSTDARLPSTAGLRLVRGLGGPAVWKGNGLVYLDLMDDDPRIPEAFKGRKQLIVLFPEGPRQNVLEIYPCGLLPYSEESEKVVAAGVSAGVGTPLDD